MKTIMAVFFSFLVLSGSAQNNVSTEIEASVFTWGNKFKDVTSSSCIGFIGELNGHIYALKTDRKSIRNRGTLTLKNPDYFVDKLDSNMNLVYSAELDLNKNGQSLDFYRAIIFNEKLFALSTFFDRQSNRKILYYQEVDLENLNLKEEPHSMATVAVSPDAKSTNRDFILEYSPDSSKIVVLFDVPGKKDNQEIFGYHIYDTKFNIDFEQMAILPYKEELFDIKQVRLDNDGSIFILGKLYQDVKREKQGGKANYKLMLLQYEFQKEAPNEFVFTVDDFHVRDVSMVINKDEVACVGYYSNISKKEVSGCLIAVLDKKTKSTNQTKLAFQDAELKNVFLRNIVVRPDGSFIVVGEEFYVRVKNNGIPIIINGVANRGTNNYYYYNDIIITSISPDLEMNWFSRINKSQKTKNDSGYYSSFYLLPTVNELVFFYNDHVGNKYIYDNVNSLDSFRAKMESTVGVCVKLNAFGEQEKEAIFWCQKEGIMMRPKAFGSTKSGSVLVFSHYYNDQRYGKLKMKIDTEGKN